MKKKILLAVLISLFAVSFIIGAWYFSIHGTTSAKISSLGNSQDMILSFSDMSLNTTSGSANTKTEASFAYNRDGNFTIEIVETFIDNSAGLCQNGINDCVSNYTLYNGFGWEKIWNGKDIQMQWTSNPKMIRIGLDCIAYACPQTRDYSIKLTEKTATT